MVISSLNPRIQRAAAIIQGGGIVAYPTEAVWGLGCDPFNEQATNRILALKRRQRSMGLILIAATINQLQPFLKNINPEQRQQLLESWPGPNTWLIPDNGLAPDWITGGRNTLAMRVTDHPLASALCQAVGGPIVSTSANPHGLLPARSALKVRNYFGRALDDVLPGRVGIAVNPSTIRDLLSGHVIRAG